MPILNKIFENKKIGILGFGHEGQSTLKYLLKCNSIKEIQIFDDKNFENTISKHTINKLIDWPNFVNDLDLLVKSPGIPWTEPFYLYKNKIVSQVELFLKYSKGKSIGITGSAGKSSTTLFTHDILKKFYPKTFIGGNYGIPLLDIIDLTDDDTFTVIELSSYQLKHLPISPKFSVFLNFYPDHLDYHKTIDDYFESKCQIYKNQLPSDLLITSHDLYKKLKNIPSKVLTYDNLCEDANILVGSNEILINKNQKISLHDFEVRGNGFKYNLSAAIAICLNLGVDLPFIQDSIKYLKTPPHRLENLGSFKGVTFFNDSIATIPETTLHALDSIKEADCLIIGGYDRGLDQSKLVNRLKQDDKLKIIVCMGQTGKKIYDSLHEILGNRIFLTNNLHEAVQMVVNTKGSLCCLFSPGAPSFGLFRNFEERGNTLRKLIQNQ